MSSMPDRCVRSESSRRSVLKAGLFGSVLPGFAPMMMLAKEVQEVASECCVFNKPLQHLDYEAQAALVAEMGFDGIEGTVRPGGHVLPERVAEDLPRQMEALRKHKLRMTILTSDVNNADEAINRKVLEIAAKLGVKRFRTRYYKYKADQAILGQLETFAKQWRGLVAFCKPLGIQPLYQNHAGAGYVGAGIWDLQRMVEDTPVADGGVAFDIRHAAVEGGTSWPTEFQLIRPHIGALYCKDFTWDGRKVKNVPLGSGMVDYPRFIKLLRKANVRVPVSLHMEYVSHRDPKLLQESIDNIRRDLAAMNKLFG